MYPSFPFLPSRGCCIANLTKYRQLKVTKLIVAVVQASLATVGSPLLDVPWTQYTELNFVPRVLSPLTAAPYTRLYKTLV